MIRGYVALLDAKKLGLGLLAYIRVYQCATGEARRRALAAAGTPKTPTHGDLFREAVRAWPEVVACDAMTGEMDFLLRVQVRDMDDFSRFVQDQLLHHPSVIDVRSSFSLERIQETTAWPLR